MLPHPWDTLWPCLGLLLLGQEFLSSWLGSWLLLFVSCIKQLEVNTNKEISLKDVSPSFLWPGDVFWEVLGCE